MSVIKRVLIVEDEEGLAEAIKVRLEKEGYAARISCDGDDALEKVRSESPDLIILDIMLPKLDGYSVAKRVRERELSQKRGRVPIIMLTARTSDIDGDAGYAAGGDVYIKKPFEIGKLVELIKMVFAKKKAE